MKADMQFLKTVLKDTTSGAKYGSILANKLVYGIGYIAGCVPTGFSVAHNVYQEEAATWSNKFKNGYNKAHGYADEVADFAHNYVGPTASVTIGLAGTALGYGAGIVHAGYNLAHGWYTEYNKATEDSIEVAGETATVEGVIPTSGLNETNV